jgi:hypothetical protein
VTAGVVFFDASARKPLPNCMASGDDRTYLEQYVHANGMKVMSARRKRALGADGAGDVTEKPVTHFMYGNLGGLGNLSVPRACTRDLAQQVANDWQLGCLWAITENPSGSVRRMYFDFDMKFNTPAERAEAEAAFPVIARAVYEETRRFFGKLDDVVAAAAPASMCVGGDLEDGDGGAAFGLPEFGSSSGGAGMAPFSFSQRSGTARLLDEGSQTHFSRAAAAGAAAVAGRPLQGSAGMFTALVLASGFRPTANPGAAAGGGSASASASASATATALAVTAAAAAAGRPAYGSAGIHIVFPKLYVTVEQALYIAAAVISRLNAQRVPGGVGRGWEDRLDRAVYSEHRGLRWAWQVKAAPCPACNGRDGGRAPCSTCRRVGHVPDRAASWYTPRARIVDGELVDTAALAALTGPTVDLLVEASIRGSEDVTEPSPGWDLYEGHPPLPCLRTTKDVVRVYDDVAAAGVRAPKDAAQDLGPTDSRWAVLQAAARRMRPEYRALCVSRVLVRASTTKDRCPRYRVYVSGAGATYCQNKRGSHKSSSIRFWATHKEGLAQECHSPHTYNGTLCTLYKSACQPFTAEERAVLFPTLPSSTSGDAASAGPGGRDASGHGHGHDSTGTATAADAYSAAAMASAAGLHPDAPLTVALWSGMGVDPAVVSGAHAGHTPRELQVASLQTVRLQAVAARRAAALAASARMDA